MTKTSGAAREQPPGLAGDQHPDDIVERLGSADHIIESDSPPNRLRYVLVLIGAVCIQVSAGIVLSGLSMFTDRIRADLWPDGEVSRAQVQSFYSVILMVGIAVMPIAGRLIGRLGGRKLLVIGGLISSLGIAGLATAQGMAGLYLFSAITGLGFGMSVNYVPIILVNTWFDKFKGVAMGTVVAGTGVGGMVGSLVFSNTNQPVEDGGLGWRASMLIGAALYAVFCLIPAWLLVVNRPSDVGLPVYGRTVVETDHIVLENEVADGVPLPGLKVGEAIRSGWFWLLYAALIIMGVYYAMGQITQPYYINQGSYPGSGVTPALAGALMTAQMIGLIVTKPLLGALTEAIGMIKAMAIVMIVHAVAGYLLGSVLFPTGWWIFILTALVGAGFAIGSLTPPLVCAAAFGQRDYPAIYGVLGSAYPLGLAVGSMIWSAAGMIGADAGQPWQLYRVAMKWCWILGVLILAGYFFAIRGGRARQHRLHAETR
ncbi:MFS transporter [Propionimicrobium sp. PCR01-08-3]|uniref:MFS transporter n=1 Tax=Propionimicrobium sp. PCR01-08-3 TaxID=3052086 RepID=UPI00255C9CBC|nr:MFS transporter [Propionimicrobium sp. PCR01-08-3]WIY84150.1 MFS transporter [Propionimicrobium sp. PCR01-08-3]